MARQPLLRRALATWLCSAAVVSLAIAAVEVAVQGDERSGANDPQVQLATDAVAQLNSGTSPVDVVGPQHVDLAVSLSPHLSVFDGGGHLLASSATLDGATPTPPGGVLQAAQSSSPDIVTWQPRPGVRVAAVAMAWHGGTVLAGRSLTLVEQREDVLLRDLLITWAGSLLVLAGTSVVAARLLA